MAHLTAERRAFIRTTCLCLAGAVLGFAALSALLLATGGAWLLLDTLRSGKFAWVVFAAALLATGGLAARLLDRSESLSNRCLALGLAVLGDSLLFAPVFAHVHATAIGLAAALGAAALVIGGGVAWAIHGPPRAPAWFDKALTWAGLAALAAIVVGIALHRPPAPWAMGALFALAAVTLVHHGAQLLANSPADRPGGAALNLFASTALARWVILSVLQWRRRPVDDAGPPGR